MTAAGLAAWTLAACGEPVGEPAAPGFRRCEGPAPILDVVGQPTGFVRCADGSMNRIGSWTGDPETYAEAFGDPSTWKGQQECREDADCGGLPERCVVYVACKDLVYPRCEVVCGSDEDCLDWEVCVPPELFRGRWPICDDVGDCRTGADCASGECGAMWFWDWPGVSLGCRSARDTCRSDDDCTDPLVANCLPSDRGWNCEEYWGACD